MAKKQGASQQPRPPGKQAPGETPSTPKEEVGALAKLEKVAAAQYQRSATQPPQAAGPATPRPAAPISVAASAKFDTLTFIVGCVVAVALAVAGYYYLASIQIPVSQAFSTSAVRLGE